MEISKSKNDTEELDDSFLYIEDIEYEEGKTTYMLRWIVRDYARIVAGILYSSHYIQIGKSIHNLRLLKQDTKIKESRQRHCSIYLGLTPKQSCANISFTVVGNNEEIHPETRGRRGRIPDRKCFFEFSESDLHSEYLDLVAMCRIQVDTNIQISIGLENSNIHRDFESIYYSEQFSDMKVCVGDTEFNVHKVVLAARSPVFSAMLQNKMSECLDNRIEIKDANEMAVAELLKYLYAGTTVPLTVDLALDLLELSDKYDVSTLKMETVKYLRCNFSIDNILDILVAADLHGEKELKTEAIAYVAKDLWYLLKKPKWKAFRTHLDLVDCILAYLS